MKIIFNLVVGLAFLACAPGAQDAAEETATKDGIVVDASATDTWVDYDVDGVDGWELSFQRYRIKTNGGASGDGGVTVAFVDGVAFDALSQAPAEGYVADAPALAEDGPPGQPPDPLYAMGDWYDYEGTTHTLTPKDRLYVLKTASGATFKIQLLGYYDAAGSPARVRFKFERLAGR